MRAANAQIGAAKATIATAKGQIENARAIVKTAELNLGFTRILSPIDGVAGIAQAQVGNLISTTSSPLTTVSTVDPIKVYFTLNEQAYLNFTKRDLIDAQQGASVAQLELELILADGTSYPQKGSFFFADRQVDPKTGAIRMAGVFPNPGVTELQGSFQVAVVGADNKIEIRSVKVSDRTGTMWIIEDGLKPGETVVAEGTQKVKPGAVVNPKPFASSAGQQK